MPDTRGNAAAGSGRLIGRGVVPTGERVVFDVRPSVWMVVLRSTGPVTALVLAGLGGAFVVAAVRGSVDARAAPFDWGGVRLLLGVGAVVLVGWFVLDWWCRRYVLTERRAVLVFGVLHQRVAELPTARIQTVGISKPLLPRLLGLGHVGLASAGTDGYEVVWRYMRGPEGRVRQVRGVAGRVDDGVGDVRPPGSANRATTGAGSANRGTGPVVIGLAGGVGSGKSTVARMLADLGCVVVDSDALSRAALAREDVKRQLREWWGDQVFTQSGDVDRSAVARIVFGDEGERRRLESLIHPLIEAERADRIRAARVEGVVGVVIDAPLLFEAGLEGEADAVMFVDSPLEARLTRVRESRGWDEAELRRREKAQTPLEEKARRSDHKVVNAGDLDDLRRQVSRVFTRITEAQKRY